MDLKLTNRKGIDKMETKWPHWLPKSDNESQKLTEKEYNYILPIFTKNKMVDSVFLNKEGKTLIGHPIAIKSFMRRFVYLD